MAGVAALIGLPLFFEVGVVLLVPVIVLVGRRSRVHRAAVGIPALAGLSVLHGLVPPHPGPLVAIDALKRRPGLDAALRPAHRDPDGHHRRPGVRQLRSAGGSPSRPRWRRRRRARAGRPPAHRRGREPASERRRPRGPARGDGDPARRAPARRRRPEDASATGRRRPGVVATVVDGAAAGRAHAAAGHRRADARRGQQPAHGPRRHRHPDRRAAGRRDPGDVHPRRRRSGFGREQISAVARRLAAGDRRHPAHRRRRRRVQAGAGRRRRRRAWSPTPPRASNISPLLLGWLVAVGIRLATGSATVATITAAGIVAPLADRPRPPRGRPAGAGHRLPARCSSRTSTTPGSGWSRSTSG